MSIMWFILEYKILVKILKGRFYNREVISLGYLWF